MTALIDAIAGRLDGHTLVLFTSYGPLKRSGRCFRNASRLAVSRASPQGLDGTRRQILQSFLGRSRTVLLATSSFWEGFDIRATGCAAWSSTSCRSRCRPIRWSAPAPSDSAIRSVNTSSRCDHPAPSGFGRLIRSASDRGAVVLCDPRLRTRQYGLGFLRALPPAPMAVTALDRVPAMVDAFVNSGALPDTWENHWNGPRTISNRRDPDAGVHA